MVLLCRHQKQLKLFFEPWDRGKRRGRFQRQRVILREPEGRVEVLRRKQGAYSGIKAVRFLICIGRDAPFGAKPPQAGSTESLMFPAKGKELFYHKGCKFTYVGADQTRRRSLRGVNTPWFCSIPRRVATTTSAKLRRAAYAACSG